MTYRRPRQLNEIKSVSGLLRGALFALLAFAALFAMACMSVGANAATKNRHMPNLPVKTLGGKQLWADVRLHRGWRVQCHVWTQHCRLLDAHNVRRAWGGKTWVVGEFDRIAASLGRAGSRHLVLLVHGIARGPGTFGSMPERLQAAGFDAHAISYPSTRKTIDEHAGQLQELLRHTQGYTSVSFVTHSMGGLVVREMMARDGGWQARMKPQAIVMIAPPNQGSMVAEFLKDNVLYKWAYGPAGQQLVPEYVRSIPVPDIPFSIIAGGRGDAKGYNPFLPGDDDGTVRVVETHLVGSRDFVVLSGLHGLIAKSPEVTAATISFLKTGSFGG